MIFIQLLYNNIAHMQCIKSKDVGGMKINEIILEKRKIAADTALRLAKFFSLSAYCDTHQE